MKLTAFDPDASVYRDHDPARLKVVRCKNGNDELIVMTTPGALDELPPMNVPQPTEPLSIGASWKKPPPRMWQEEIESPWMVRLYGWGFVAAIVVSALYARFG